MQIYRISSIRVVSIPLIFVKSWWVIAFGLTRSSGWTNPRLVQEKDDNGLAVFSFEADAPAGVALDVLTPIVASVIFSPGAAISGVKVTAETNAVSQHAQIVRALADGSDDNDFLPLESDSDDEAFDADAIEQFRVLQEGGMRIASTCADRTLLKIPTRPEFKMKGFKLYRRFRYNVTALHYCYPSDLGEEAEAAVRKCLPVAIAAGVAAFPGGGPGGAVAAFFAALKGCVGAELGSKVTAQITNHEEIGKWHRV